MWNRFRPLSLNRRPRHLKNAALQKFKMMSSRSDDSLKFSKPIASRAAPESASDKSHWVRDAGGNGEVTGFVNPWESSRVLAFPALFKAMMKCVLS